MVELIFRASTFDLQLMLFLSIIFSQDAISKLMPLLANTEEHDVLHALLHTFAYVGSNSHMRVGISNIVPFFTSTSHAG